jgi:hypothetical protein
VASLHVAGFAHDLHEVREEHGKYGERRDAVGGQRCASSDGRPSAQLEVVDGEHCELLLHCLEHGGGVLA